MRKRNTWNRGRAWTIDRNKFNKNEKWEIPMSDRKQKKGGFLGIFDEGGSTEEVKSGFLGGEPTPEVPKTEMTESVEKQVEKTETTEPKKEEGFFGNLFGGGEKKEKYVKGTQEYYDHLGRIKDRKYYNPAESWERAYAKKTGRKSPRYSRYNNGGGLNGVFVGYHCSEVDFSKKNYDGEISEDYFDRFEEILKSIKDKYKKAESYLNKIQQYGIEYDSELSFEIKSFFDEIGLNWIFVDEYEPLKRYGKICYSVRFKNSDYYSIKDYNEEDSDYSYAYFYFKNNPPHLNKIDAKKPDVFFNKGGGVGMEMYKSPKMTSKGDLVFVKEDARGNRKFLSYDTAMSEIEEYQGIYNVEPNYNSKSKEMYYTVFDKNGNTIYTYINKELMNNGGGVGMEMYKSPKMTSKGDLVFVKEDARGNRKFLSYDTAMSEIEEYQGIYNVEPNYNSKSKEMYYTVFDKNGNTIYTYINKELMNNGGGVGTYSGYVDFEIDKIDSSGIHILRLDNETQNEIRKQKDNLKKAKTPDERYDIMQEINRMYRLYGGIFFVNPKLYPQSGMYYLILGGDNALKYNLEEAIQEAKKQKRKGHEVVILKMVDSDDYLIFTAKQKMNNGGGIYRSTQDLEKVANFLLENSDYYTNKAEEYDMDVYDLYEEALEEAENMDKISFYRTLKLAYSGKKMNNGGGIEDNFDYGSDMTDENIVRENLMNGEISCEVLRDIIGCEPEYPYQIVGSIKLQKCFLRPYYKLA